MRIALLMLAVVALLALGAGRLMADDVDIYATFTDLLQQESEHGDLDPFKGYANIYVTNDTDEYWTNFELGIGAVPKTGGGLTNISATIFVDYAPYGPTSSQNGLSWVINNDPAGAQMALYFVSDPIAPGDSAWFKVYTDNTTYKERFRLCFYPTIPEPSSLFALFGGVVGLLGFRLRKRT